MAYAFLGQSSASSSGDNSRVDVSAVDTSGANLIVAVVSDFQSSAATTLTDSKGNTWSPLTQQVTVGGARVRIIYTAPSSVGSGHTFAAAGAGSNYPSMEVMWFSGAHTTPFDVENGAQVNNTVGQPGSVSPSEDNELLIVGEGHSTSGTLLIGSSFTGLVQRDFTGGANFGSAMAYKIQTTAGAENPQWTSVSGTVQISAAVIATFKSGSGGGGGGSAPAVSVSFKHRNPSRPRPYAPGTGR